MLLDQFPDRDRFKKLARSHNVIPVCAEILADTDTPVLVLKKIYQGQGPAFLLESVEGGERWGRYSFLSTSAITNVRVLRDKVVIAHNGNRIEKPHNGAPMPILREFMAQFNAVQLPELPRFWGGLVGYLTYEMVAFIEAIPNNLPPDTPLAHFMLPDELIIFDNIRHSLMAVVLCFTEPGDDPDQVYDAAQKRVTALLAKINQPVAAEDADADNCPALELHPVTAEKAFRAKVEQAKTYIKAGDIIQAVISQPFQCNGLPDIWTLYRAQRYINPSPYMYFMHLDDTMLVGSSPETMVRLENGVANLRPIAGTRRRGGNEQEDRALADELLKDEKERAEHLMLVDLGRNDLGRVAETGSVQVTDLMVVERYSHVMHLVSNIICDLKAEYDAWDLFAATFPAGTLSGAPKVRAMQIIEELEDQPRGPYGGAVGYVSFNGNMDLAITIRTACVENGTLTVRAGAGIVADSDPESERMETVNKAMAIQKALQLCQKSFKGRPA